MNVLGEIKYATKIGKKGHSAYVWQGCVECGAERWVVLKIWRNGGS